MALNFGDLAVGGGYLKPAEFADKAALLVEVHSLQTQVPTNYGPKDTLTVDITSFDTAADIDNDNGIYTAGMKIQQIDLVNKLRHLVGSAAVLTLEKLAPSAKLPNGAWVWRQPEVSVRTKVVAFAERREAAADEVPDFS